ncbi:MAG: Asp-tRNA(Asn)/Glu-tRNA(Gln) amidotransferase subunit GatC [Methylococcales bacterium]|jgi:aspartyl-tRNA(Asn)/glutamyl-tRNA(Gln) amidotransferase subunit C|nr:Asp-tRNA(Asn)/Glu-tRNA(Gln) amidotransferase subunit GatC [Methylococcales bacterium]
MSLNSSDIEKIAQLAKLNINQDKQADYLKNLGNILQLVDKMQTVDTDKIAPMAHPLDGMQRLRTDEVTEKNQRKVFQEIAPATEAGLYLVPKVIE